MQNVSDAHNRFLWGTCRVHLKMALNGNLAPHVFASFTQGGPDQQQVRREGSGGGMTAL